MNKPFLLMIAFTAISINLLSQPCTPTENEATYGTGNRWRGYVYQGTAFNIYRGMVYQGTTASPNFDQSFGGAKVTYNTSACSIVTDTFSVRYRLARNFSHGIYTFVVGADAGYRLSMDGGLTWAVSNWTAHTYTTTSYNVTLSGVYDMVLEYYDNLGSNRIMFSMIQNTVLPVKLLDFTGKPTQGGFRMSWRVSPDSDARSFEVERSTDGSVFTTLALVSPTNPPVYQYIDAAVPAASFFYRLKVTDQQGSVIYSGIITRRASGETNNGLKLYPSILQGSSLFIKTSKTLSNASVLILDATGRAVHQQPAGTLQGGQLNRIELSESKLSAGVYFMLVLEGRESAGTCRFIVQ